MTTPVLILWPIYFDTSSYTVRVATDVAGTEDLSFSVTESREYWVVDDDEADSADDSGGIGSVLRVLEETLETHSDIASASVSLTSDFFVEIEVTLQNGASWAQILWPSSTIWQGFAFGFDVGSDSPQSTTFTGEEIPDGIFRPRRALQVDSGPRKRFGSAMSKTTKGRPIVRRLVEAEQKQRRNVGWSALRKERILEEYTESTAPTNTLESLFLRATSIERRIRLYEDEDERTQDDFTLYRALDPEQRFWTQRPTPSSDKWDAVLRLAEV